MKCLPHLARALALSIPLLLGACVQSGSPVESPAGFRQRVTHSGTATKKTQDRLLNGKIPPKKGPSYQPQHDQDNQNRRLIEYVGSVPVYRHTASNAVLWKHGLMVDADGSPAAYSPKPGQGLDYLADAGHPGDWWALVTDNGQPGGKPVLQSRTDPMPGYYVSTTSLENPAHPPTSPLHWANASQVPYIVLPLEHHDFGGRLGDFGAVIHLSTGRVAYVTVADLGPPHNLGEGSVALAKALRINASPKDGGVGDGVAYVFFPNSGDGTLKSPAEIARAGAQLLTTFGGTTRWSKVMGY